MEFLITVLTRHHIALTQVYPHDATCRNIPHNATCPSHVTCDARVEISPHCHLAHLVINN